jgi:hypothetical protein
LRNAVEEGIEFRHGEGEPWGIFSTSGKKTIGFRFPGEEPT